MMNWWLDKGIGGFRMDVIELIGKDLDGRVYSEGPDMHRFIKEMHRECLAGRDIVTVGESWAATPDTALQYCGRDRQELNMVFNFNHVQATWDPKLGRFGQNAFDLSMHKLIMSDWQQALAKDGWNSLYLSNHDLPRPVSHYANDNTHRVRSAKMLAMVHYLMKGTPFIYQGEEIGMTNAAFTSLDQFRDIETLGQLEEHLGPEGSDKRTEAAVQDFLQKANKNGRDNARTPVQWDTSRFAGFSDTCSWIDANANHIHINVEADRADPSGVFAFYQRLIALRKTEPIVTFGTYEPIAINDPSIFSYQRRYGANRLIVLANFTSEEISVDFPELHDIRSAPLLATDRPPLNTTPKSLLPFEGIAWLE